MFLQLGFKALKQGKRVSRPAGESGEYAFVVYATYLARRGLDDDVAQCHLTIAAQRDLRAAPDRQDGGAVILLHKMSRSIILACCQLGN